MKKIFICLLMFLVLPSILAINLDIEKTSSDEIMILDLNTPAVFDLKITNNGASDEFLFYSFFGANMEPSEKVLINSGETKDVQIKIYPSYNLKQGHSTFNYFIKATDDSEMKNNLTVKIINLDEAFEVGSGEINPDSNSLEIYIKNKINLEFEDLNVKFSSVFFNLEETFSLGENEKKTFELQLDKEEFKEVIAGFYTLRAEVESGDTKAELEGIIKFSEKDIVTTTKKEYGFIISKKIIEKSNEGNVLTSSETIIKKNIVSRLFTSFSPEPDIVEREGTAVYYSWVREIKPGETLKISVRTNWFIPFLIIILVVAVVIFVKKFSRTNISLRKKINFVRAKGGEFALKVSVLVHAKKYVEKVNVVDRLPALVKIYERFGREQPTRFDENKRRIEWNFEKLEAGEVRVLSYIIYSKVGVVGKFALPSAVAIYEKDGKIKETQSNKTFFVAEQRGKE